jgi:hypothetical protein
MKDTVAVIEDIKTSPVEEEVKKNSEISQQPLGSKQNYTICLK